MDHHESIDSSVIGSPPHTTEEKGEEASRRLSEYVARGIPELISVSVNIHNRAFVD